MLNGALILDFSASTLSTALRKCPTCYSGASSTEANWERSVGSNCAVNSIKALLGRIFQWKRGLSNGLLILVISLTGLLTACQLPQVSAEDRLFLDLSLDFLGEYRLPKTEFQGTRVGGLSALTYDRQRNLFYAISDDRSEFAPARFYTLKLVLDTTSKPTIKQVDVEAVTPLIAEDGKPFAKGTIDPEGIALSPLRTVFISSEGVTSSGISPFVQEFDLKTGQWRRSLPIPERYKPNSEKQPNLEKQPTSEEPSPRGVQDNLGFEALTLNPGGYGTTGVEPFRLFTATESALLQDKDDQDNIDSRSMTKNRLLHYLVEDGRSLFVAEHLYPLSPIPEGAVFHGLTELLTIDQGGHFLSLERSFGSAGVQSKLFQLAFGSATDTSAIASLKGDLKGIQPIQKKLLLDLNKLGIFLDNLEGMSFGPQLPDGSKSLVLLSDDNFSQNQVTQFLLFRLKGV